MIVIKDFWKYERIHKIMWHTHIINLTSIIKKVGKYIPKSYLDYVKNELGVTSSIYIPLECAAMRDEDMVIKDDIMMTIPMRLLRQNKLFTYYFDVKFYRYCCGDLFVDYEQCAHYCDVKNISAYDPEYVEAIIDSIKTIMIITRRYYDN